MKSLAFLGLFIAIATCSPLLRSKRGLHGGYGGGGGGGYATNVLIAGGGAYGGLGEPYHTLNSGGGPYGHSHLGPEQEWYENAAIHSGDVYAAKAIGAGQYHIAQADAAAYGASAGISSGANTAGVGAAAVHATDYARHASLSAAASHGALRAYSGNGHH